MCMLNGRDGMDVVSNVGATFIAVPLCVLLAGSRFASWISCLFLCSESDNGGQQRQVEGKSVKRERDMMINTQPELVSPMRLGSCDGENGNEKHPRSLPLSPPLPRPQRTHRDNTMSRRSSIRASLSFNRKSTIGPRPSAIRISAPSDFRRVQSMTNFPASKPQPQAQTQIPEKGKRNHFLELSIYNNPHHALPDLPSFDNFHVTDAESPIKRPQRVFSSPPGFSLPPVVPRSRGTEGSISGSASFRLPRKPVGTAPAPRRSSTAAAAVASASAWPVARPERQRYSTPASPLIPHFATVQRTSMARPVPRSLSMGMGPALDREFRFTLQNGAIHATNNDHTDMTPPISPSPTLTSPQSQSQFQHKPLPLPLPPSQSQPGPEHTRSWSGSTLASSTYTCTYSPKGFDVSVISRPGSRTGLGQGAVVYPFPAPTIYEGKQVVGYI